jgi:hypothetical protein
MIVQFSGETIPWRRVRAGKHSGGRSGMARNWQRPALSELARATVGPGMSISPRQPAASDGEIKGRLGALQVPCSRSNRERFNAAAAPVGP